MPSFLTPISKQSIMIPRCSGDETLLGPSVLLVYRSVWITPGWWYWCKQVFTSGSTEHSTLVMQAPRLWDDDNYCSWISHCYFSVSSYDLPKPGVYWSTACLVTLTLYPSPVPCLSDTVRQYMVHSYRLSCSGLQCRKQYVVVLKPVITQSLIPVCRLSSIFRLLLLGNLVWNFVAIHRQTPPNFHQRSSFCRQVHYFLSCSFKLLAIVSW